MVPSASGLIGRVYVTMASSRPSTAERSIVRPSHTYDKTLLPFDGEWTVVDRMRRGAEVVVPGDRIIILMGHPVRERPLANLMRVHRIRPL